MVQAKSFTTEDTGVHRGLLLSITEEDDVAVGVATNHAELFAIERPVEIEDLQGIEIGDLTAGGAIERLEPEIVGVLARSGVHDGAAIRCELNAVNESGVGLFERQQLSGFPRGNIHDGDTVVAGSAFSEGDERSLSAVGGNVKSADDGDLRDRLRSSALQRNFHQLAALPDIFPVEHGAPVGCAHWKSVVPAGGQFGHFDTVGVPSPDIEGP